MMVESRALLTGDDLADAQPAFDQQTNQPIVTFRFNTRGATHLRRRDAGECRPPLRHRARRQVHHRAGDPRRRSSAAPARSRAISPSRARTNLSVLLRAGALPADLTIVEERTVGPSLGQDSIRAGAIASVVALVAVVVFMVVCYGILGFFADIAMIANTFLMIGILTATGATLTLARHRRHRAHHGHGGRRERAHLRAHARGGAARALDHRRRSRPASSARSPPSSTRI